MLNEDPQKERDTKKARRPTDPKFENQLYAWVCDQNPRNIALPGLSVQVLSKSL